MRSTSIHVLAMMTSNDKMKESLARKQIVTEKAIQIWRKKVKKDTIRREADIGTPETSHTEHRHEMQAHREDEGEIHYTNIEKVENDESPKENENAFANGTDDVLF